uniref:Neprilysin n=1 Tax=Hemiscolopendra marginata TaxID=943146 RepID=A0A646QCZ4_9MYRI
MAIDNGSGKRIEIRIRRTICSSLSFVIVLSFAVLVFLIYIGLSNNAQDSNNLLTSRTKRSICINGNCNEGLNEVKKEIICPTTTDKDSICLSKDCTLTAATLISAMDFSIDPCKDFYKFSCANFIRKNIVPEEKIKMSTSTQYEENYLLQQKNLIEDYNPYGEPDVVFRLQEAYHVCINTSFNKDMELAALKNVLDDELGGWPMAMGEKWKPKRERLEDYLIDLHLGNIQESMFLMNVIEEFNNATNTTQKIPKVEIKPFYLWPIRKYKNLDLSFMSKLDQFTKRILDEEKIKVDAAKKNLLFALLKLFGNPNIQFVQKEIKMVFEFEDRLDKLLSGEENFTYMTIEELIDLTNGTVDWVKLLNGILSEEISVNKSDKVLVDKQRLKELPEILDKFPMRVLRNTITWKFIFGDVLDIGIPGIEQQYEEYEKALDENFQKAPRWKYCLKWISKHYPLVLTRMYIKTFVDRNSKETVDEIIKLVQEAYKQQIKESSWLDETTKQRALQKADAIKRFVGYPELIFNDTEIEDVYSHIPKVYSTHFANAIEFNRITEYNKRKDVQSEKKGIWLIYPLMINAFYILPRNSIWFPSGILQLPYFAENRPAAVNFGTIGFIIGHEIGHAFGKRGSTYNENGDEENWWSNGTKKLYKERIECFINQYDFYCPEDLQGGKYDKRICVDGDRTVGENMADNTGLKAGFAAYKMWIEKHGEEKRLPGLAEYSPEQIYFISSAYSWCENIPTDKWLEKYEWDTHSPGKYRILGSMSNSEEFREAFNCPVGDYNRGNDSCVLW